MSTDFIHFANISNENSMLLFVLIQIKRIYYSHFVDYFNLEAIDNSLYLSYGDGEVQIYNDELNEWRKGPTIDYNVLDVSMCMLEVNPNDSWLCHQ